MLAAGALAEEMARGGTPDVPDLVSCVLDGEDVETDNAQLRQLVAGLTVGEAEAWLADVLGDAVRILEDRWGDVELVAEMLVIRRRLTRLDLCRLLPGRDRAT